MCAKCEKNPTISYIEIDVFHCISNSVCFLRLLVIILVFPLEKYIKDETEIYPRWIPNGLFLLR